MVQNNDILMISQKHLLYWLLIVIKSIKGYFICYFCKALINKHQMKKQISRNLNTHLI